MKDNKERKDLMAVAKTADIFDKALNALFWIFLVCACIAGGFCALSFIPGIPMSRLMDLSSMHLSTDFIRFNFAEGSVDLDPRMFLIYTCALMIVPAAFFAAICRELKKVISPIKEGRPFTHEVSLGVKNIAIIYLAGEVVGAIVKGIVGTLFYRAYDLGHNLINAFVTSAELDINASVDIIVPILLLLISWIVKYGENLQKLEDETL